MSVGQGSPRGLDPWGEVMLAPDEVAAMVQLQRLGWGTKRIAAELGCSRNTVKRDLAAGGWVAIRQPRRQRRLDGLDEWLTERFRRHRGHCDVVRQDLLRAHGITVSLRTVERAVAPGAAGRGAGLLAVRDGAGPAAADRFRGDHRGDRRRPGAGASVCGDLGLFAAAVCARLPARAAISLVRRHRGGVPALWRGAARWAVRQCAGVGRAP
jgi:hypothetical protein